MQSITLSLHWGPIPVEHRLTVTGEIRWNAKMCGLQGADSDVFAAILGQNELYKKANRDPGYMSWVIETRDAQTIHSPNTGDSDGRINVPLEFVAKYIQHLETMRYKIVSAPTEVSADKQCVWTLSRNSNAHM